MPHPSTVANTIADLFAGPGASAYLGEDVTIAQHMLQAAALADTAGAGDEVIAAALLHDIGHLSQPNADSDDWHREHDRAGARFLAPLFEPLVAEPVGLHVAAKRYLCAIEDDYHARLSPASVHTLALQGGPMTPAECRAFEGHPAAEVAVSVRRFDEGAKALGRDVPRIDTYRALIARLVAA